MLVEEGVNRGRRLSTSLPPAPPWHPWQGHADLIREYGGIADAHAWGFAIVCGDGERTVEFEGGLTAEHYDYFSPLLDELDEAALAKGVLENLLRPMSWLDLHIAWKHMWEKYGIDEEDWLPDRVKTVGFTAIAQEMRDAVTRYRKTNPAPQFNFVVDHVPRWDPEGSVLSLGNISWKLRKQHGPIRDLLNALEEKGWPSQSS